MYFYLQVSALKEPGASSKSISLCSKLLAIATSTVNILVRGITSQHTVQRSLAGVAAETFLVVSLGSAKHLLSMEYSERENNCILKDLTYFVLSTTAGASWAILISRNNCGVHILRGGWGRLNTKIYTLFVIVSINMFLSYLSAASPLSKAGPPWPNP